MADLPQHLIALLHHVELNRVGWWENTLQQLALGVCWLVNQSYTASEVTEALSKDFGVAAAPEDVQAALRVLGDRGTLVQQGDTWSLSQASRTQLDLELTERESVVEAAKGLFLDTVAPAIPGAESASLWIDFNNTLLLPMLDTLGARALAFIKGEPLTFEVREEFDAFLSSYHVDAESDLALAIQAYLDPTHDSVRRYVARHMYATFLVHAANLDATALKSLEEAVSSRPSFRLFLDTNFLFSWLHLHDNPSNDAAISLRELSSKITDAVEIDMRVVPESLNEAKSALSNAQFRTAGITLGKDLYSAAKEHVFSGLEHTFFAQASTDDGIRSPDEYFSSVMNNLLMLCRQAGVELYNVDMADYRSRPDVIDDTEAQREWQEERRPPGRRKPYEAIVHDVCLWHLVSGLRDRYVESPLSAREWIITVDYGLLGFDSHKVRPRGQLPVCLHPTALVHMLQFWLPREEQVDIALFNSFRLPFLFKDFDAGEEEAILNILSALSRFEGAEQLSPQALTSMLVNAELRRRMRMEPADEEQVELVRQELINTERELREKLASLQGDLSEAGAKLQASDASARQFSEKASRAQHEAKRAQEEASRAQEEARRSRREASRAESEAAVARTEADSRRREREELDQRVEHLEQKEARRRAFGVSAAAALCAGIVAGVVVNLLLSTAMGFSRPWSMGGGSLCFLWVWTEVYTGTFPRLAPSERPGAFFNAVRASRLILRASVGTLLLAVIGEFVWDQRSSPGNGPSAI